MRNIIRFGGVENRGRRGAEKSDYQEPRGELETPELWEVVGVGGEKQGV